MNDLAIVLGAATVLNVLAALYSLHRQRRAASDGARQVDRDLFTLEQLAEYLQVPVPTLYRSIEEGRLPTVRIGDEVRVTREGLDLFLLSSSTLTDTRAALFERVLEIAGRNPGIPLEEVERDVAKAVAHARRRSA